MSIQRPEAGIRADTTDTTPPVGASEPPNRADTTDRTPGSLVHAAITYARAGWPVFPLRPGAKDPFPGSRGFKDATTDPDRVAAWWARSPAANIGLRTGVTIDVLDVDVRLDGDGWDSLERLARAGLLRGAIAQASTRNGGRHLIYPASGASCRSWKAHHLDLKAAGGYIVAPPSVVPSDDGIVAAGRYEWLEFGTSKDGRPLDVAAVDRFLNPPLDLPAPRQHRQHGDVSRLVEWVASRPEGDRNGGLYWAAKRAESAGEMTADVQEHLIGAAIRAGLTRGEAAATVKSGIRNARRTA